MLNLIKGEMYKYLSLPYMYLGVVIDLLVLSFTITLLYTSNSDIEIKGFNNILVQVIQYIVLRVSLFTVILSGEYRYGTMKNLIVSTTSRVKIFWGKFISQCIIAFISYIIVFTVFIMIISILEGSLGNSIEVYKGFIIKLITIIPVLLGILAFANLFVIVIRNDFLSIPIYFFGIIFSEKVIMFLSRILWSKFILVKEWLIMPQLMLLINNNVTMGEIIHSVIVGFLTLTIGIILSSYAFHKSEVN